MCSIILLCYTLNRFIVYKTRLLRIEMTEKQYKENKAFFLRQKAHFEDMLKTYQRYAETEPYSYYNSYYRSMIEDAREDIKSSELRLESLEDEYKSIPILTKQISMMRTSIFISFITVIVLINLNFF